MGLDTGGIYLFDDHSKTLNIAAQHGFKKDFIREIEKLEAGESFRKSDGKRPAAGDTGPLSGQPVIPGIVKEDGLTSVALVPLCSKQKTLDTLFMISQDLGDFDADELQLLLSAGQQIGDHGVLTAAAGLMLFTVYVLVRKIKKTRSGKL